MIALARPRGWRSEGTHTGGCGEAERARRRWADCPTCWGQGRIWLSGGWAVQRSGWIPCPTCIGVGQVGRWAA